MDNRNYDIEQQLPVDTGFSLQDQEAEVTQPKCQSLRDLLSIIFWIVLILLVLFVKVAALLFRTILK